MADAPRKSSRPVKIRKEPGFLYDEESVKFLHKSGSVEAGWQLNSQDSDSEATRDTVGKDIVVNPLSWSDIFSDSINTKVQDNLEIFKSKESVSISTVLVEGRRSQSREEGCYTSEESSSDQLFDNNIDTGSPVPGLRRGKSSTTLHFLSVEDCFLSVSPTVHTDTSGMSEADGLCLCDSGKVSTECCVAKKSTPTPNMMDLLQEAVEKIGLLSGQIAGLQSQVEKQDKKIIELEKSSSNSSSDSKSGKPRKEKSSSSDSKSGSKSGKPSKDEASKTKKDSVEDEKVRQLKLLQDKLRKNVKCDGDAKKDKDDDVSDSSDSAVSSDESINFRTLKKKMTRKQRDRSRRKLTSRLKQSGSTFPEEEPSTTSSSGTDAGGKHRRKRRVKSGAKISKRPVVRTELWPHTIANEDDGEDVTSENINLAKFYSCFTYIMLECDRIESKGRTALLHAVSLVLESLFWSEARSFHNIVMVKIEQGRINWRADFEALAESFIDKKVRLSVKSKNLNGANSSKSGFYNKGYGFNKNAGKGFNKKYPGKNKPVYSSVCKQWNYGTCSYGDRCNRWHCCWTCAENGKIGEAHKASSHNNGVTGARQAEARP